jgi:hypothetical protein
MIIVAHRRNTIQSLRDTPTHLGVEMDIRSYGSELIVHHEPFVQGENFLDWVDEYRHSLLILNVKEEGLEERILKEVIQRGIKDFFFLDQSFPFLIKTAFGGEKRCALRVSEYECLDTAINLSGKVDWVWVDCFSKLPIDRAQYKRLKNSGFKVCLVSPELQGRKAGMGIREMRENLDSEGIIVDAVCTKSPELWK